MVVRRIALPSIAAFALLACTAATTGLGDSGAASESAGDTETETGSNADDGDEGSEAEGDTGTSPDLPSEDGDGEGDGDGDGEGDGDGDGDPSGETDDPGTCGNGFVDDGEECDGSDLGGIDCAALGFVSGELACSAGCSLDTSGCISATCGNGIIDDEEECDGQALDGADCESLGFGPGTLTCSNSCVFDSTSCTPKGEGQQCGLFSPPCPSGLSCAKGKCYDGSEGDPCYLSSQCQAGLKCKNWNFGGTCKP